jgi:hypothetical protein
MGEKLVKGRSYRWREIGQLVGHEPHGYLTQFGQKIVCGCFRKDLNPDAPSIVLPGGKWVAKARLFQRQGTPIPVFVKEKSLFLWKFVGQFCVEAITQNRVEIQIHRERHDIKDIGEIMFLSESKFIKT